MSKNNVYPDHYKVGGRDRQDDAAAARFVRAIAAKTSSRERPDRMAKGPYFQRPEPSKPKPTPPAAAGRPGKPAQKKSSSRAVTAKKSAARKASAPRRPAATRKAPRKSGRNTKPATRKK
jgi:hypothetical protein